jgi:gliding motility-associated protein GldC
MSDKTSEIKFTIHLDEDNIPEKILWDADDKSDDMNHETRAISLSLWDHESQNTLRIDLWSKEMPIDEMKRFYIDAIGGLAQSLLNATGDEYMAGEMDALCEKLIEHVKRENRTN